MGGGEGERGWGREAGREREWDREGEKGFTML